MTQPWDRLPREPNRWYDRFERFRLMGSNRAIIGVYNGEREKNGKPRCASVPPPWNVAAHTYNWRERAEAWDEHNREIKRQEDQAQRDHELARVRELRRTTIQALQAMLGRVITAEQDGKYNVDSKTLRELSQAAANIFKESRLEFGEPTAITDVRSGGQTVKDFVDLFQLMGQREK